MFPIEHTRWSGAGLVRKYAFQQAPNFRLASAYVVIFFATSNSVEGFFKGPKAATESFERLLR